jgi:hypothetical protein
VNWNYGQRRLIEQHGSAQNVTHEVSSNDIHKTLRDRYTYHREYEKKNERQATDSKLHTFTSNWKTHHDTRCIELFADQPRTFLP